MGVPTSHIHFAPKQAQSFHKIYVACCSKTHIGAEWDSVSRTVLPRVVRGCHNMHNVSHVRLLTRLMGLRWITDRVWPRSMMSVWLWPLHWTDHNWALAVSGPAVSTARRCPAPQDGRASALPALLPGLLRFGLVDTKSGPCFNLSVSPWSQATSGLWGPHTDQGSSE